MMIAFVRRFADVSYACLLLSATITIHPQPVPTIGPSKRPARTRKIA